MRICVTGGAGFIGSAFVHMLLDTAGGGAGAGAGDPGAELGEGLELVVLDALTYAGNMENLADYRDDGRMSFIHGSICDTAAVARAFEACDAVVNFAAESHVDRSLEDAGAFIATNVEGTRILLDAAVEHGLRFVQVSTDEVYGSLGDDGLFYEDSPLRPSSPYAASKAAADLLVGSYVATHGLDAVITRCGNNYGPRQFPEKLIPLFITNALEDKALPLYGDGLNVRDWIHVDDHCRAIATVLLRGTTGRVYNVSATQEVSNREVCRSLLELLDKPWDLVRFVSDRPGHDRRYALSAERLRSELSWQPRISFAEGLAATVDWYRSNRGWWERVRSGDYRCFYERLYGRRLSDAGDSGENP